MPIHTLIPGTSLYRFQGNLGNLFRNDLGGLLKSSYEVEPLIKSDLALHFKNQDTSNILLAITAVSMGNPGVAKNLARMEPRSLFQQLRIFDGLDPQKWKQMGSKIYEEGLQESRTSKFMRK